MEPNANEDQKILLLPGDLLKLTITVKTPVYVSINFEDVPAEECVHQLDICYGGVCD